MNDHAPQRLDDEPRLSVLMQVQISQEMADRLDAMDRKHGMSRSAFTRLAITERLERYERLDMEAAQ